jgi:hypothetical protein
MRRFAFLLFLLAFTASAFAVARVREIAWADIAPALQSLLMKQGITRETLPIHVAELRARNQARMREGDLDHLVYYMLQSSSFTRAPVIEPATSAAAFVAGGAIPDPVNARIGAFASAMGNARSSVRLAYFRDLVARERTDAASFHAFLSAQYVRAMRFLYEKEFGEKGRATPATSTLYQDRGLSTDTSVDAGYIVYLTLATLRQLEPNRRIQRVLVIGPGLDLAPRTGLVETRAPQSYQPFAVVDALVGTGLADRASLHLSAIDINPRVVQWLEGAHGTAPELALYAGVRESKQVHLADDYRSYFASLGKSIGVSRPMGGLGSRQLSKTVKLFSDVTAAIDAATVDITVERVDDRYDLIVVTNVFPYLSDAELLLALGNVVQMLKPGGVLLHNEPRPLLANATVALGLPLIHSRSAVVATVDGGPPLYDAAWMHKAP